MENNINNLIKTFIALIALIVMAIVISPSNADGVVQHFINSVDTGQYKMGNLKIHGSALTEIKADIDGTFYSEKLDVTGDIVGIGTIEVNNMMLGAEKTIKVKNLTASNPVCVTTAGKLVSC